MKQKYKIIITVSILAIALAHVLCPKITIDSIAITLIIISLLPWIAQLVKEVDIPGVGKITFLETKAATDKISKDVSIEIPTGKLKLTGHQPTVKITPSEEKDPFESIREIFETDPKLALVAFRIEIELRLRAIASSIGEPIQRISAQKLTRILANKGLLKDPTASGLIELISMGNRVAHGTPVDSEAAKWVLDVGPSILQVLDQTILVHKKGEGK